MSPRQVVAQMVLIGVFGCLPAAKAATAPFSENFDSVAIGDTAVPNFTESTTSSYTVVADSGAGDNNYRAIVSSSSAGVNASSAVSLPGLAGNAFTVSTDFSINSFTVPNGSTVNMGLGILGNDPNFSTGAQYRILFTLGGPTPADIGVITIQESGTFLASQVRTAPIGVSLGVNYTMSITATYSGAGITFVATATRTDTGASTTTTVTDSTPQAGQYFGCRTAVNGVNGTASESIDYDNFSVVPEPSSALLLLGSAACLMGRVRRRRVA